MAEPLLRLQGVTVRFPVRRTMSRSALNRREWVHAVDGVDLALHRGEILGLVGESGSGKSTLARVLVGLEQVAEGKVIYADGVQVGPRNCGASGRIQIVFQDPYSSLNPRISVGRLLCELLKVHNKVPKSDINDRAAELLRLVGLPAAVLSAYPRQLSGGQRQRVAIARALAVEPEILVADEPTSALDVSVQANILNLLEQLRRELSLSILFISHDLAVVRHISDRVAIMYKGRIVEIAHTSELFRCPKHPYTTMLLQSIPRIGENLHVSELAGTSAVVNHKGCRFQPRCPVAVHTCEELDPGLLRSDAVASHLVACHVTAQAQDVADRMQ